MISTLYCVLLLSVLRTAQNELQELICIAWSSLYMLLNHSLCWFSYTQY